MLYPVELRALLKQILIAPNVSLSGLARTSANRHREAGYYIRVSPDIAKDDGRAAGFEPPDPLLPKQAPVEARPRAIAVRRPNP